MYFYQEDCSIQPYESNTVFPTLSILKTPRALATRRVEAPITWGPWKAIFLTTFVILIIAAIKQVPLDTV